MSQEMISISYTIEDSSVSCKIKDMIILAELPKSAYSFIGEVTIATHQSVPISSSQLFGFGDE